MRKTLLALCLTAATLGARAQEIVPQGISMVQTRQIVRDTMPDNPRAFWGNRCWDNWYFGIHGGAQAKTSHQAVFKHVSPAVGLRFGKWLTPSVGLSVNADFTFSDTEEMNNKYSQQIDNTLNLDLMMQANLMNIFSGYQGEPRSFEIIPGVAIGWLHNWTKSGYDYGLGTIRNALTATVSCDFAWNFGKKKQWQFFVEPEMQWLVAGAIPEFINMDAVGGKTVAFNVNYSFLQLNVGLNYRFKTSNGTHNFCIITPCDETEIAALNAEINALRAKNLELDALRAEIARLRKALKDCEEKPAPVVVEKEIEPNLPAVFYPLNKSIITPAQAQNVAIAATVMKNHPEIKLMVKGYASPEGPHDNNNSLSVRRAAAVKDLLVKKYRINPSRITTEGCGETDQLFEIYEFNRVAMLYIDKK